MHVPSAIVPIFLFLACVVAVALALFVIARLFNPSRAGRVQRMPYESGMDPIHGARRQFHVRFYLLAIAFLVFDVELVFLYPWAVATRPAAVETAAVGQAASEGTGAAERPRWAAAPVGIDAAVTAGWVESRDHVFLGAMVFIALLTLGFIYDWRKGVFRWR